jgi:hypothetical protein
MAGPTQAFSHLATANARTCVRRPTTARPNCGECDLPLRWEQIGDDRDERWLAICDCGLPWVSFPGRPGYQPENPLAAALLGARTQAEASPPWIRVFQMTSGYPWWLPWRHVPNGCQRCAQHVTFAVWTSPAADRRAYSALCLACGEATSEHLRSDVRLREAPVSGNEWSPPCVAVARLRRAVFSDGDRGGRGS